MEEKWAKDGALWNSSGHKLCPRENDDGNGDVPVGYRQVRSQFKTRTGNAVQSDEQDHMIDKEMKRLRKARIMSLLDLKPDWKTKNTKQNPYHK